MSIVYFAHNGVNHGSEVEAATHGSNTMLWMIAATLATAAIVYVITRALNRAGQSAEAQESDAEDE